MKRLFDVLSSMFALVLLAPAMMVVALAVAGGSEGGAFFKQVRVGKQGKPFQLLKFRTMRLGSEARGQLTVGGRVSAHYTDRPLPAQDEARRTAPIAERIAG